MIQEWTDERSPVLCHSLFPCSCVFPLTSGTWDGSIPAFFLLPTRPESNKTCLLIYTTGCAEIRISGSNFDSFVYFILLWDVAMLLNAPTAGKRRGPRKVVFFPLSRSPSNQSWVLFAVGSQGCLSFTLQNDDCGDLLFRFTCRRGKVSLWVPDVKFWSQLWSKVQVCTQVWCGNFYISSL